MTTIVLQVQGAEPRCFLLEIRAHAERLIVSVWALSAFDAMEQGGRALPSADQLSETIRLGRIDRVALCAGFGMASGNTQYAYARRCDFHTCALGHVRIGVLT